MYRKGCFSSLIHVAAVNFSYWEEASLRLASTARVSKVTLLTKDSFIFKIGNLHPDDLSRIEDMYRKFLKDNGAI